MRLTRRHIRFAALGGVLLATGIVVPFTIVAMRTEEPQFIPPPPVAPSTAREVRPKSDDVLLKLSPGMLRVDVEAMLGPPTSVDSIRNGNGRLSYRATFSRDRLRPPLPPLELEFDATRLGHPLILAKPM